MNERIRELMLEAGYAAPELAGRANKLVELIVRECADIVEETRWMVPPSQEQIARSIKQHFGFE